MAGLQAEQPDLDWVLPDIGGVRWQQAVGVNLPLAFAILCVQFDAARRGWSRPHATSARLQPPAHALVGAVHGESNILEGTPRDGYAQTAPGLLPVSGTGIGGVSIRPEMLGFRPREGAHPLPSARIVEAVFQGATVRVTARCSDTVLTLRVPPADMPEGQEAPIHLQPGGATTLEGGAE